MLVFVLHAWAQDRTVSGTVTDAETGEGLPGVNVLLKGTGTGQNTDLDGNYKISVPSDGGTLVFSFIGMAQQEIEIGSRSVIDVQMEADVEQLSEVVVVGYGETTKQSFSGSLKTVDPGAIERKSVSNISQGLAGEVAGVNVVNTSGQPGTEATVRIRGIGSVNGNSAPLYVLDGVPYFGSINAINPNDIASTTILKDATATAIYGSRGANGVILINTKKGNANESYIEIDGKFGQNQNLLPRYDRISSPEEYIALGWEGLYNRGQILGSTDPEAYANARLFSGNGVSPNYNMWNVANAGELIDPATRSVRPGVTRKYDPENWEDYAFQPSTRQEGNIRLGGGNEAVRYFTSVGYLKDVGYSINSDFERVSSRFNLSHQLKPWLSGSVNIGYTRSETNNGGQTSDSGSVFWFVDNIPSIYPLFLRDAEGNKIPDPYYGGNIYDYGEAGRGFGALTNSISDANINVRNRVNNELNGSANINIDFNDDLSFESTYGWQYLNSNNDQQNSPFYGSSASTNGSIFKTNTEIFNYTFTNLVRYQKDFGVHSISALAAHESNRWERSFTSGFKQQLVDPFGVEFRNAVVNISADSYVDDYSIESYFGQVNYNFNQKYYLTGSVRRDGSSRFLKDKWGTFGSIGGSWVMSNEEFLRGADFVKYLKLKSSYGLTGDQAGVDFYPGYDLLDIANLNGQPSLSLATKGNPDLTWEVSNQFQTGLEFNLWNRIDASVDYYVKTTDNLIFERRVGPSLGYALIDVNDGALRNSGIEFDVTGHILKGKDYYLDLSVNGEIISNELLRLPIDPATGEEKEIDIDGIYGRTAGRSIFDFYMREFAGVNPEDGASEWTLHYNDVNGNGEFDAADEGISSLYEYTSRNPDANILETTTTSYATATQKFLDKTAIPAVRGAFNLAGGWKGINVSALVLYSVGGYAYDGAYATLMHNGQAGSNNWHTDIRDRWQQEGDITDVPRLSNDLDLRVNSASSRFLTPSDFLNVSNIRVGYTFPTKLVERIGVKSLSIFAAGDNLALFSYRDGFNPSTAVTGASSMYRYSPLSTLTGGLKVKF